MAAINVVAQEHKVGVGGIPRDPEELQQVVELAVDVSHDRDWRGHDVHILMETDTQGISDWEKDFRTAHG